MDEISPMWMIHTWLEDGECVVETSAEVYDLTTKYDVTYMSEREESFTKILPRHELAPFKKFEQTNVFPSTVTKYKEMFNLMKKKRFI